MPGDATTALAIINALGFGDHSVVSSSSKYNPVDLKKKFFEKALRKLGNEKDPFKINDVLRDPLHISIAGIALGAIKKEALTILAGGTQMLAVLSLMKSIEPYFNEKKVILATTRWIYLDKGKEVSNTLNKYFPGVTFAYVELNFFDAPYEGLEAGGSMFLAVVKSIDINYLKMHIYEEYKRIVNSEVLRNG